MMTSLNDDQRRYVLTGVRPPPPAPPPPSRAPLPGRLVKTERVTIRDVLEAVMFYKNMTRQQITSDSKVMTFVEARFLGFYVAHVCYGHSLPQIGSTFRRDHSTVHYGAEVIRTRLGTADEQTFKDVRAVCSIIDEIMAADGAAS